MAGSFLTKGTYSAGKHVLRRIAGEAQDAVTDSKTVGQLANQIKGFATPAARKIRAVPSRVKPSAATNHIPDGTDVAKHMGEARANRTEFVEKATKVGDKKLSDSLVSKKTNISQLEDQKKGYNLSDADKGAAAVAGDMPREVGGTVVKEGTTKGGKPKKLFVSEIPDMSYQELHHELMKALYSNYVDMAWKLIDDPLNPTNRSRFKRCSSSYW